MSRKKKGGEGAGGSSDGNGTDLPPQVDETSPREEEGGKDNVVPLRPGDGKKESPDDVRRRESPRLKRLNDQYCVVKIGGKVMILEFVERDFNGKRRKSPSFLRVADFRAFHQNKKVIKPAKRGGGIVEEGEGDWWLDHPERRTYNEVVFDPTRGEEFDGKLNLWRGWGVEEANGDWSLMRAHITDILGSGVREHGEYIIKWVAWAIQNPEKVAEVVLALIGKRGVGKGVFADALLMIFGQHSFATGTSKHLKGDFNLQFMDTCLLFADEAIYPGDHRAREAFKHLVTEKMIAIEGKGKDPVMHPNRIKAIMAANPGWSIPAGEDERRYAIFDVSDKVMQDRKYFSALIAERDNGGLEAMLWDLRRMDLGDWHPREIVRTKALLKQQVMTMEPFDQWLLIVLEGSIIPGHLPKEPDQALSVDHPPSAVGDMAAHERERLGLFSDMRRANPRLRSESDQRLAGMLKEVGCERNQKKFYSADTGRQYMVWKFPPLAEMRADFGQRFAGIEWDDQEAWTTDLAMAKGAS